MQKDRAEFTVDNLHINNLNRTNLCQRRGQVVVGLSNMTKIIDNYRLFNQQVNHEINVSDI